MMLLALAWTLWAASLWTAGSSEFLAGENVTILYPKIDESPIIECNCVDNFCDSVYWFRSVPLQGNLQFLGKCNTADRVNYGSDVDEAHYKLSKRGSFSFSLRINSVTEKDSGIYSCVLKDKQHREMWKPGFLLLAGVTPPTLPPKPKPTVKSVCTCKKSRNPDGCHFLVLWPLVGVAAGLALALTCILYYFSRLPKKCNHHFVKRRK